MRVHHSASIAMPYIVTAPELVEILQGFPSDAQVRISHDTGDGPAKTPQYTLRLTWITGDEKAPVIGHVIAGTPVRLTEGGTYTPDYVVGPDGGRREASR